MTTRKSAHLEVVAGGGLLHRRVFLSSSIGAAGLALLRARPAEAAQQEAPAWMKAPGQGLRPYGERSPYESTVQRLV
jgi:sulfane dehydrogenase subunit SoxC